VCVLPSPNSRAFTHTPPSPLTCTQTRSPATHSLSPPPPAATLTRNMRPRLAVNPHSTGSPLTVSPHSSPRMRRLNGGTSLHAAVCHHNVQHVKQMAEHGADLNARDAVGNCFGSRALWNLFSHRRALRPFLWHFRSSNHSPRHALSVVCHSSKLASPSHLNHITERPDGVDDSCLVA